MIRNNVDTISDVATPLSELSGIIVNDMLRSNTIVQQNAANAQESTIASKEMNTQAGQLKQFADSLAIFVFGKR